VVQRRFEGEDTVAHGKARWQLSQRLIAKLHSGTVGREPEVLQETAQIHCSWPLKALLLPGGIQHAPSRLSCPKDAPSSHQR
jgi:hypothetical protein